MECIWVDPEEHRGPAGDLCYIVVENSSLCAIHRTVEKKMGNGFVVEAALTLWGVCAIELNEWTHYDFTILCWDLLDRGLFCFHNKPRTTSSQD